MRLDFADDTSCHELRLPLAGLIERQIGPSMQKLGRVCCSLSMSNDD
jgi:hypothetical protein